MFVKRVSHTHHVYRCICEECKKVSCITHRLRELAKSSGFLMRLLRFLWVQWWGFIKLLIIYLPISKISICEYSKLWNKIGKFFKSHKVLLIDWQWQNHKNHTFFLFLPFDRWEVQGFWNPSNICFTNSLLLLEKSSWVLSFFWANFWLISLRFCC